MRLKPGFGMISVSEKYATIYKNMRFFW